jgi:hypothetical protein
MNTRQRIDKACAAVSAMIEAEAEAGQARTKEAVTRTLDLHGHQENAAFGTGVFLGSAIGSLLTSGAWWWLG